MSSRTLSSEPGLAVGSCSSRSRGGSSGSLSIGCSSGWSGSGRGRCCSLAAGNFTSLGPTPPLLVVAGELQQHVGGGDELKVPSFPANYFFCLVVGNDQSVTVATGLVVLDVDLLASELHLLAGLSQLVVDQAVHVVFVLAPLGSLVLERVAVIDDNIDISGVSVPTDSVLSKNYGEREGENTPEKKTL